MRNQIVATILFSLLPLIAAQAQTIVGIRGSQFTINGYPTYTAAGGFPSADPNLEGTLLNVRTVQAIFDDANYPGSGFPGTSLCNEGHGQHLIRLSRGKLGTRSEMSVSLLPRCPIGGVAECWP